MAIQSFPKLSKGVEPLYPQAKLSLAERQLLECKVTLGKVVVNCLQQPFPARRVDMQAFKCCEQSTIVSTAVSNTHQAGTYVGYCTKIFKCMISFHLYNFRRLILFSFYSCKCLPKTTCMLPFALNHFYELSACIQMPIARMRKVL